MSCKSTCIVRATRDVVMMFMFSANTIGKSYVVICTMHHIMAIVYL